jgi:hypothetical protein
MLQTIAKRGYTALVDQDRRFALVSAGRFGQLCQPESGESHGGFVQKLRERGRSRGRGSSDIRGRMVRASHRHLCRVRQHGPVASRDCWPARRRLPVLYSPAGRGDVFAAARTTARSRNCRLRSRYSVVAARGLPDDRRPLLRRREGHGRNDRTRRQRSSSFPSDRTTRQSSE